MTDTLVAPFPYYGGKRRYADRVWEWLGDPQAYVEPFCGSAAVLLARPDSVNPARRELINDSMGQVANFWRAVKHEPVTVAGWMDCPNSQVELASRQQWFDLDDLNARLRSDPGWFDSRLAGVWAWGVSCSIPMRYPHGGLKEQGLTNHYQGANQRGKDLVGWCQNLADRLRHVQVHAGRWQLALTDSAHMHESHSVGVFLDPPYDPAVADTSMYDHGDTWTEAAEWAFSKGDNPNYRIVLCGYTGSYETPPGWRFETLGGVGRKSGSKMVEGVWLSPHTTGFQQERLDFG